MTQITNTSEPPTATEPSSGFTDFILNRLRVDQLRFKSIANEIEAVQTALSAGLITPEVAILVLAECGAEVSS